MEKVNFKNIIKSYFLGIFICIVILLFQLKDNTETSASDIYLILLASGSMGFIIGLITERVTSILPISIAKPRNYFFINNLIAIGTTALIMLFSTILIKGNIARKKEFIPLVLIIIGIVFIANIMDYMMYQRAQSQLKKYKELIKDK